MAPSWLHVAISAILLANFASSQTPLEAKWSSSTIGPDGPWQAVEVKLGNSTSPIALYPGNIFSSWILTTDYCNNNRSSDGCFASAAGTYNKQQARDAQIGSGRQINFLSDIQNFAPGLDVEGGVSVGWMETMEVGGGPVPNVSMNLIDDQMLGYPSGQWYPISAGCLGLGASGEFQQTFADMDTRSIHASLVPGWLWKSNETPSNSFGLHIGSVSDKIPGSLWWGGYDQHRISGDTLSTDLSEQDSGDFMVSLKDISIEVVDGISPFNFSGNIQSGLLRSGGKPLPALVNGCSPYLSLPKSTCDRITQHLPVTFDSDLGLYLWNTDAPDYHQIVSSASALVFALRSKSGSNSEINVRVPFRHLNLTLDKPLVEEPTPYFPCFTGAPDDRHVLGRAFMQDAFIGANWGAETWWIAQAPGPNLLPSSSYTAIKEKDTEITGGGEDWKASWDGVWHALSKDEEHGERAGNKTSNNDTTDSLDASDENSTEEDGLTTGAVVGISIGAGALALGVTGALIWICWRRRRAQRKSQQQRSKENTWPRRVSEEWAKSQWGRNELEGEWQGSASDVSKQNWQYAQHGWRKAELEDCGTKLHELA